MILGCYSCKRFHKGPKKTCINCLEGRKFKGRCKNCTQKSDTPYCDDCNEIQKILLNQRMGIFKAQLESYRSELPTTCPETGIPLTPKNEWWIGGEKVQDFKFWASKPGPAQKEKHLRELHKSTRVCVAAVMKGWEFISREQDGWCHCGCIKLTPDMHIIEKGGFFYAHQG
jgi:hypothetical protein